MRLKVNELSFSKSSPSIVTFASDVTKDSGFKSRAGQKHDIQSRITKFTEVYGPKRHSIGRPDGKSIRMESDAQSLKRHTSSRSDRRYPYMVIEAGKNFTPKPMSDVEFPNVTGSLFSGRLEPRTTEDVSTIASTTASFCSRYSITNKARTGSFTQSFFEFNVEHLGSILIMQQLDSDEEVDHTKDDVPSMFRLREGPPTRDEKVKTKFTIHLQETETMFLLVLPTAAVFFESEEGKSVSEGNERYDKVLEIHKSISHSATQTREIFEKNVRLEIPRAVRANTDAWATSWDIYDTYLCRDRSSFQSLLLRQEGQVENIRSSINEAASVEFKFEQRDSKDNERFVDALMVMERLIEQKSYRREQLLFHGCSGEDPLSLDFKCTYRLEHLWTFKTSKTAKQRVTSMSWSWDNMNILAVGYGKFGYEDKCDGGAVRVWNVKNPTKPERCFRFVDPVTFVSFSPLRHQILAVSCYSGKIILVDIVSRSLLVKATNSSYPMYYPVWQVRWLPHKGPEQYLLTCGKNGIIYKYKKTKSVYSRKMMALARPHGTVQGVEQPRKCFARKVLASGHPSAQVLILHPVDPTLYLVGSSEGCVYVCSLSHRHDYVEMFVAHNGPVYSIQYNPYCSKVLLTCGADCCIRIWAEGVYEPLATLESGIEAVQDAVWDPLHSTVILNATGNLINVWDIRRNTSNPKSSTMSPGKSYNTVLQFSGNKCNVCVGDVEGNVHVMALTEMPFCPTFQEEVLVQALYSNLTTRPGVRHKLKRIGHPFNYVEKYSLDVRSGA